MLCCQGFGVKNNYDFTLGRLAYESLRPVQDTLRRPEVGKQREDGTTVIGKPVRSRQ